MIRNPFWRNTRTEKHRPDDPLATDPPPAPAPARDRKCVCEFCGCQLTPSGEVMKMGEKAREFRKHEEVVEARDRDISRLNSELAAAKQEIADLKRTAEGSGGSSGFRPGAFVG